MILDALAFLVVAAIAIFWLFVILLSIGLPVALIIGIYQDIKNQNGPRRQE